MNSGSSACICSHGHSVVTILAASWYQKSREGFMSTAEPVRLTTTTQSTPPLLAIGDALGETVGREAGKHHRMNCADPRAGQHRIGGFRNHRQIDGDAVAPLDVAGAQDVGEFADFVVKLPVADVL